MLWLGRTVYERVVKENRGGYFTQGIMLMFCNWLVILSNQNVTYNILHEKPCLVYKLSTHKKRRRRKGIYGAFSETQSA